MNELERIVARTRTEVARRSREVPLEDLDGSAARQAERPGSRHGGAFLEALKRPGLSLIAEHKRRSPSAGLIRDDLAIEDVVMAYERGGAAALSILTEESSFGGSLADIEAARAVVGLPILRKDFIVDPYQVTESVAGGADAILLIVAVLSERELSELQARAIDMGLAVLVEVHDEREVDVAMSSGARLLGINNRDLMTLEVDPRRTFELLPKLPADATVVAESGFSRREQLAELAAAGVAAVLVGEALMRSPDIELACRALTSPGPARAL